ncbi:ABC transporter ATP-binding protein [Bacillus fonticola]|uniref:ABC transporter ATP-binding protein n=1 Tax=Bacillus fonticola TaxID=2728853 RepID=UPI001474E0FE|nr:ABC transporter ATP-binding protein [Bacillus fonticola]
MTIILELHNLEFAIDNRKILKSISFSWEKGESIAFIGGNGVGKSTLLKIIALLHKPTGGNLMLPDGISERSWKNNVGVVFPENFLYDSLTSQENLRFYQHLYGKADERYIDSLLHKVQLGRVMDKPVGTYSKGMKQRLSIARALVHQPEYLLLDEPFDGLDLKSKVIIEGMLAEHKHLGNGYILVSHDVKHAFELCERAILLHDGKIVLNKKCSQSSFEPFINTYRSLLER